MTLVPQCTIFVVESDFLFAELEFGNIKRHILIGSYKSHNRREETDRK